MNDVDVQFLGRLFDLPDVPLVVSVSSCCSRIIREIDVKIIDYVWKKL
jgi:hypothetical protein